MTSKYYFLAVGLLLDFGCSTSGNRVPNSSAVLSQNTYSYSNHFSCEESQDLENKTPLQFSALSGMNVGPKQDQQFKTPTAKILRPFASDGCSASPDGIPATKNHEAWAECCVVHDTKYWAGGTAAEKVEADSQLEQCISGRGYKDIGKIYKLFVTQFGGPKSSQSFRWGYGWNYKRGYGALTPAEENQISMMYGGGRPAEVRAQLANTTRLTRICDSYDVALRGYSVEEKKIYAFLNRNLKQEEHIDWMRADYFNSEKLNFLIKFDRCDKVATISISKDAQAPIKVTSDCELF